MAGRFAAKSHVRGTPQQHIVLAWGQTLFRELGRVWGQLDTAGVITTGSTTGRASFVPAQDATVVARLRAAGAILLGKTNTPELTLLGRTITWFTGAPTIPMT